MQPSCSFLHNEDTWLIKFIVFYVVLTMPSSFLQFIDLCLKTWLSTLNSTNSHLVIPYHTGDTDDVGCRPSIEPTSSVPIFKRFYFIICKTLALTFSVCTVEMMLRTIIMQNFRLLQAWFPIKIIKVWIDRYCVRYDWWRRPQLTSSVSPVCHMASWSTCST